MKSYDDKTTNEQSSRDIHNRILIPGPIELAKNIYHALKPSGNKRKPAAVAKPKTITPKTSVFQRKDGEPLHAVSWHPGLKVFGGSVHGKPLGRAMSERSFYSHLTNKHSMSHEKAVDFIHAAKHGETSPNDATLPIHHNLMMAAHHLDQARESHILGNRERREAHLHFVDHHMTAAHSKAEGGVKTHPEQIKKHWETLSKKAHALDRAMREDRFVTGLAPLAEALAR